MSVDYLKKVIKKSQTDNLLKIPLKFFSQLKKAAEMQKYY